MKRPDTSPLLRVLALLVPPCLPFGCTSGFIDYPNRLVGADGQSFTLDDLEAIAADTELSEAEKREAFRALGIEDEMLIDALLAL